MTTGGKHGAEYDVLLINMPGDSAVAVQKLSKVFGIDNARAQTLLESLPTVVKHRTTLEAARGYYMAFLEIGAESQIREAVTTQPIEYRPRVGTARREVSRESLPPLIPTPTHDSSFRWSRLGWLIPVIAAGLIYWRCTAGTMGGLDVQIVGVEEGGVPAVVLLHGYGAPGKDLVPLAQELAELAPNIRYVIPEAPFSAGLGRSWWNRDISEAAESRESVTELIDELIDDGTSADMIFVIGFSQGAVLAMDVALRYPELLGGVAFLSGSIEKAFNWNRYFETRSDLPVFIGHGRSDNVVPMRPASKFAEELEASGFAVEVILFDGGHTVDPSVRDALADILSQRF